MYVWFELDRMGWDCRGNGGGGGKGEGVEVEIGGGERVGGG